MLLGTIIGVLLIPGLYYIFGSMASKIKMTKKQEQNPLSEEIDYEN
jgi:HAE1 family hydrophobic/amphiphilic exporter-1